MHPGAIVIFRGRAVGYLQLIDPVRYNPGVPTTSVPVPLPEIVPFDAVNPTPANVSTEPPCSNSILLHTIDPEVDNLAFDISSLNLRIVSSPNSV